MLWEQAPQQEGYYGRWHTYAELFSPHFWGYLFNLNWPRGFCWSVSWFSLKIWQTLGESPSMLLVTKPTPSDKSQCHNSSLRSCGYGCIVLLTKQWIINIFSKVLVVLCIHIDKIHILGGWLSRNMYIYKISHIYEKMTLKTY